MVERKTGLAQRMRHSILFSAVLSALSLSACAANATPIPSPTIVLSLMLAVSAEPSGSPVPTATRGATLPPQQLPPTWTVTLPPPSTTPLPTLPLLPTETLTVTPAISPTRLRRDGPPTPFRDEQYLASCIDFGAASTDAPQLLVEERDITVAWKGVEGAEFYELWLINTRGQYLDLQRTEGTSGTFKANRFLVRGSYGWEVYPIASDTRACASVTGLIVVR